MTYAAQKNVVSFVEPGLFEKPPHKAWPFENECSDLEPRAYSLVMIDPAWTYRLRSKAGEKKSPQSYYKCMKIEDIRALPVADLGHPDGCLYWIWCTAPMLHIQIDCAVNHWGLKFVTSGTWIKTSTLLDKLAAGEARAKPPHNMDSFLQFGAGYVLRNAHEPFLICSTGVPEYCSKSVRSTFFERTREHSRKPEKAYAMAKKLVPYGRAADVFTRERRAGWEPFGDELDKFDNEGVEDGTRTGKGRGRRAARRGGDSPPGDGLLPLPSGARGLPCVAGEAPGEDHGGDRDG